MRDRRWSRSSTRCHWAERLRTSLVHGAPQRAVRMIGRTASSCWPGLQRRARARPRSASAWPPCRRSSASRQSKIRGSLTGPMRVGPAQPDVLGQVVVHDRALLGVGGDDDVAGARGGRGVRTATVWALLLVSSAPVARVEPEGDEDARRRRGPSRPRARQPGGAEQQQRADEDREVAVRPRRRDLRGQPRERERGERP